MDLKSLMVDSKEVWIDFPSCKGFKVKIANPSRTEITKLRTKCTSQKFDRKTRQLVETLDEEKFVAEFTKATVKDWAGLTIAHLETLVLIEPGSNPLDTEVEYSEENAEMLVNNSQEFDQWLNEVVFDLDNFRSGRKGKAQQRLEKLFNNLDAGGMTKDRYITMCEQLGKEPNEEEMPPDIDDLPDIIQKALHIYNSLGDRVLPEVGFLGKDYTNLWLYMDVYKIEDKEFFLDIISWLDSRAVKKSAELMKREMDKLKRKSSGPK